MQNPISLEDVRLAGRLIRDNIERTPFRKAVTLSRIAGVETWLKFENLQFTASFKERGVCNKLAHLAEENQTAGVVAMSAGNHAQGVAYHAHRLGMPATIVMPKNTPFVKVQYTKAHGATVILEGDSLADAASFARNLATREGLNFIHPYDDALIIAGQGTLALEMLEEVPALDCLVIPIGGGGLICGMAIAAKAVKPDIKIIGVETALYPAYKAVLDGTDLSCGGDTLAEGIAVTEIGALTLPIIQELVDEVVTVDETALEHALTLLLNVEKTLVEGAGAAGYAAILSYPSHFQGLTVGTILSGGNIDSRLLASVLMRELVRDGRITRLRILISDVPGEIARIADIVAQHDGNFIDLRHHRIFTALPAKDAVLDIELETRDRKHLEQILDGMRAAGYNVRVLNPDEPD